MEEIGCPHSGQGKALFVLSNRTLLSAGLGGTTSGNDFGSFALSLSPMSPSLRILFLVYHNGPPVLLSIRPLGERDRNFNFFPSSINSKGHRIPYAVLIDNARKGVSVVERCPIHGRYDIFRLKTRLISG